MAFVQEIEADKIGDSFNVFSAFVRVPLLILGGVLGSGGGSKNQGSSEDGGDDDEDMADATAAMSIKDTGEDDESMSIRHSASSSTTMNSKDRCTTSKERYASTSASATKPPTPPYQEESSPSCRIVSDNDIDEEGAGGSDSDGLNRSNKKMSWSDSYGLRLVQYDDENLPHEPCNALLAPKSALKKKSITERDPPANSVNGKMRYIPSMGGAPMNMPSFTSDGGNSPSLSNGYVSPEWGWYINTTPPTPEMYSGTTPLYTANKLSKLYDAPSFPTGSASGQGQLTTAPTTTSDSNKMTVRRSHNNPIFQNLQSTVTPNMGWTSVPI